MKKTTLDTTAYKSWLRSEGYQPSTIEVSLRRLLHMTSGSKPKARDEAHARRYLRFVADTRCNPMGRDFYNRLLDSGFKAAADTKKSGKRTREPLDHKQWVRLLGVLRGIAREKDDDTVCLLLAYMHSDCRISVFLGMSRKDALEHIHDGHSKIWVNTHFKGHKLYRVLCDSERCAYARMRRRLQVVAEKLGYDVDLDTLHRSRRKKMRTS